MRSKSDAELMGLVLAKHRPALEELYDRHVKLVYSFAMKATKEEQAARDIVQQVFTRLWTTSKGYDSEKGQFANWLITVTRNMAVDYLRRERKRQGTASLASADWEQLPAPQEKEPEAVLTRKFVREEIREAYSRLSESQIRLLERVYWEGYTLSEAALLGGEPLGTVKSRLHQSLKLLRSYLQKQREDSRC